MALTLIHEEKSSIGQWIRRTSLPKFRSKEHESEVIARYQAGDPAAAEEIVRRTLGLVAYILKRDFRVVRLQDDVIQACCIGVLRAAKKFDLAASNRFSSFVSHDIKHTFMRWRDNEEPTVRAPVHLALARRQFKQMRYGLAVRGQTLDRQMARTKLGITEKLFCHVEYNTHIISLDDSVTLSPDRNLVRRLRADQPLLADDDRRGKRPGLSVSSRLSQTFVDDSASPEDVITDQQQDMALKTALAQLNPMERRILELRFGLAGCGPHTLNEVGEVFQRSRERMRQIEGQALRKLRKIIDGDSGDETPSNTATSP